MVMMLARTALVRVRRATEAGGATVTWNPLDKSPDIALSNFNLTMTPTDADYHGVRATSGKAAGKWYVEYTHASSSDSLIVGVATASYSLEGDIGSDASGFGYFPEFGDIFHNGASPETVSTTADGTRIMMALDMGNLKIWFGSAGTWFSSDNPATNTGGYTIPSGTWFPAASAQQTDNNVTAYFNAASQSHAAPSGFLPWE